MEKEAVQPDKLFSESNTSLSRLVEELKAELEEVKRALRRSLADYQALEAELAQAKTLAALGEMAALVAHEVRNPLAGICGFAALLKREVTDSRLAPMLDKILEGATELERLTSALLNYTNQLDVAQAPVSLKDLVDLTVSDFQRPLEKEMEERELVIRGDRQYLKMALRNLIENAFQAAGEEGKVKLCLGSQKGGQTVRLSIWDNGPGISPEVQRKIFTPFFTTRQEGTGLGLAIVKKIVEAHRGRVWVESAPQQGSTFYIELPLWS